jgi:ABC-type lipoprotein export system ATPase subunit
MSITEVDHANTSSGDRAVYKSTLTTTAEQVIKPDGTTTLTKEGIETRSCSYKIDKVLNNNHGMQFQQSNLLGSIPAVCKPH